MSDFHCPKCKAVLGVARRLHLRHVDHFFQCPDCVFSWPAECGFDSPEILFRKAGERVSQLGEEKALRAAAEAAAAADPIAPFRQVAGGIPENWPDECILRFNQRQDGSLFLDYYGVNDVTGGIPIGQWRALLKATQAA